VPHRHQSIKAAFEHSWKLLTDKEQEVLRKLSVFVGGFRREAASEVVGATLPILASLVDKSFLRVSEDGRYDRHVLLHQFIQDKLTDLPLEQEVAEKKHGEYFFQFLDKHGEFKGKESLEAVSEELKNMREACSWSIRKKEFNLLVKVSQLQFYFDIRALFHEGVDFFEAIISNLSIYNFQPKEVLGNILIAQAWLYIRLGKYELARSLAENGNEFARNLTNSNILTKGLSTLGMIAMHKGDFVESKTYFEEAIQIAKKESYSRNLASLLSNLALSEENLGDYVQAEQHYEAVLELDKLHGDQLGTIYTIGNLGALYTNTGKLDQAESILREGLQIAKSVAHVQSIPHLLNGLVNALYKLGKYSEAEEFCNEALRLNRDSIELKAGLLISAGKIATRQKAYSKAFAYLNESLDLSWSNQEFPRVTESIIHLAELHIVSGNFVQAHQWLSSAFHHPSVRQVHKDEIQRLLAELSQKSSVIDQPYITKTVGLEEIVEQALQKTVF
jgi:tetratricopeptide (TPR) repeat protein